MRPKEITLVWKQVDSHESRMKDLLTFYDHWYRDSDSDKHFLSKTTYKNMRLSIRGFFDYCRLAFAGLNPPDFVIITHSNSSSIESVFALVRNMRRDTPQGFIKSATCQSSTDAIKLMSTFSKASYDASHIPDQSSPSKNLLGHENQARDRKTREYTEAIKEKTLGQDAMLKAIFSDVDKTKLVSGYAKLCDNLESHILTHVNLNGFVPFLSNDDEFVETIKAAVFTEHELWYKLLCGLSVEDVVKFNQSCCLILSILFQALNDSSQLRRDNPRSSYQYNVYRFISDRNGHAWKSLLESLPDALKGGAVTICILIIRFSDLLLKWVRETVAKKAGELAVAKSGRGKGDIAQSNELIKVVTRFFGWAVFSLKKQLEKDYAENEEKIFLLEEMTIYHSEAIADDVYMATCYDTSDQLRNNGGQTLISKCFIGFGRALMKEVCKFTALSFSVCGNQAIEEKADKLLENVILRRIFFACCRSSSWQPVCIEEGHEHDLVVSLFEELVDKTFHAWAGEQTDKYREQFTGRLNKDSAQLQLRGELNLLTKPKGNAGKKTKDNKEN